MQADRLIQLPLPLVDIWSMTREEARALVRTHPVSTCTWRIGSGPLHICPLYARCQALINTEELLMCELSDFEAGVPERTNNEQDTLWNRKSTARAA